MARYLIGVDSGGSKTDAVLTNENGQVLAHVLGGPASASGAPFEASVRNIDQTLDILLKPVGGRMTAVDAAYFGISGCGSKPAHDRFQQVLEQLLPNTAALLAGSDSINSITAEIGSADGIVAICGTGSGAFTRLNGCILPRVDGHGFWVGDDAGGFNMGRCAIHAALRDEDGRGPQTLLTELCRKKANCANMVTAIDAIEHGGKAAVASYAPCLLEAWHAGDAVATQAIEHFAALMAEIIRTAGQRTPQTRKPVILCGSLFRPELGFSAKVQELLGTDYCLINPLMPPVYGAVAYAYHMAIGHDAPEAYRQQYLRTIKEGVSEHVHECGRT